MLKQIYSFLAGVYPGNWQTRWGKTPYMSSFADQEDINNFVFSKGKFESVPGHVWACIGLWMQLRRICPNLNKLVDSEEIYERLWAHDIGETEMGDISLAVKIHGRLDEGKMDERKDFIKLTSSLPSREAKLLLGWFDEFEGVSEKENLLETLVARWVDNLQGDHFALVFGNDLSRHSETIEKIVKKRSAARSRALVDYLGKSGKKRAANEVWEITKAHIQIIQEAGIKINPAIIKANEA